MSEAILESGSTTWGDQEWLDAQTANQKDSQSARILPFPSTQNSQIALQNLTDAKPFYPKPPINDNETPIDLPSVLREKLPGLGIWLDVQQFCTENNLSEALDLAQEFVKRCFSDIQALKLRLVVDPEDDEKWIEINITVPDTDNFLAEYNNYTRLLVAEIPWSERNLLRFNFSFA